MLCSKLSKNTIWRGNIEVKYFISFYYILGFIYTIRSGVSTFNGSSGNSGKLLWKWPEMPLTNLFLSSVVSKRGPFSTDFNVGI